MNASFLYKFTNWYFTKNALPYWCILAIDCIVVIISGYIGYYLESGGEELSLNFWNVGLGLLCCVPLYIISFHALHTYQGIIRYSSYVDLFRISAAVFIGSLRKFNIELQFSGR